MAGDLGTVLGQAIHMGDEGLVSFLLQRGADPINIGGKYQTTYGGYPCASDAANSPSRATKSLDPTARPDFL